MVRLMCLVFSAAFILGALVGCADEEKEVAARTGLESAECHPGDSSSRCEVYLDGEVALSGCVLDSGLISDCSLKTSTPVKAAAWDDLARSLRHEGFDPSIGFQDARGDPSIEAILYETGVSDWRDSVYEAFIFETPATALHYLDRRNLARLKFGSDVQPEDLAYIRWGRVITRGRIVIWLPAMYAELGQRLTRAAERVLG
jgi:hypothetical protein